jgi:plasmid stability protein
MSSITIRNIDEKVKRRIRLQAAENGRSMEEEVRTILIREAEKAGTSKNADNIFDSIRQRFEPLGGMKIELPRRGTTRKLPDFK